MQKLFSILNQFLNFANLKGNFRPEKKLLIFNNICTDQIRAASCV